MSVHVEHEPKIGLWWHTGEDLLGVAVPLTKGVKIGSYLNAPFIHESLWKQMQERKMLEGYEDADPKKFDKGWVVYNNNMGKYYVLCETATLVEDKRFQRLVERNYHLKHVSHEFILHPPLKLD